MRRMFVAVVMCLVLLTGAALPAAAQTCRTRRYATRTTQRRYTNTRRVYYTGRTYDNRSFWARHRDKLTVAAGAGGGAAIGALAGGRRGALIGALLGAGGSALYTYELRDRNGRRYYRRR